MRIAELFGHRLVRHLAAGLNVHDGKVTYQAVAEELGYPFVAVAEVLG